MLEVKDKSGNIRNLTENNDIIIYRNFLSIKELEELLVSNFGKMLVGSNTESITIDNTTIKEWSSWFIPFANATGDMFAIVSYPNPNLGFWIVGHTQGGWSIKQI